MTLLYWSRKGVVPSWYGLTVTYRPVELGVLPIERVAERAHVHTLKLLAWHRGQDLELSEQYVRAAIKVSGHHKELL